MKKVYVIEDSAGWVSDYFFTSRVKAVECLNRMVKNSANIYDLPLIIHTFTAY